jgi:DNA-directed RNA polymerase specialized sigma24 family protein
MIPQKGMRILEMYLEQDDIRQELALAIITLAENYTGHSSKEFVSYLKVHLPRYLRDLVKKYVVYHYNCKRFLADTALYYPFNSQIPVDYRVFFNTKWLFENKYSANLTAHERYLLHLYFYRCMTIEEIGNLLYMGKDSVKTQLERVYETLQELEWSMGY